MEDRKQKINCSRWLTTTPRICDNKHVHPKNILRLNSTGEISSDDDLNHKQNYCYWDKMKEKATNLTNIGKLDIQKLFLGGTPMSKNLCASDQEVEKSIMDELKQYQNECVCDPGVNSTITSYKDALRFGNKQSFLQGLMLNRGKILHNLDCLQGRQSIMNKYPTYSAALSGKQKSDPIRPPVMGETKAPLESEVSAVAKSDMQSVPRYIPPYKRKNAGASAPSKETEISIPSKKYIPPKPRPPRNYTPRSLHPTRSQAHPKSHAPRQYAKEKHYSKRPDFCERNYEENWRQPRHVTTPSVNRDETKIESQTAENQNSNSADVRFNYQIRIGTSPNCDKNVLAHCHAPVTNDVAGEHIERTQINPSTDVLAFSPRKADFADIYVSVHGSGNVEPTCASNSAVDKPQHENNLECNTKEHVTDNLEFTDTSNANDIHGATQIAQDDDIPGGSKSLSCSLNIAGHFSKEGSDDKKHFKISAIMTPVKATLTETSPVTHTLMSQKAVSKKKKSRPSLKKRQRRKRQQGLVTEHVKSGDEEMGHADIKSNKTLHSSPKSMPQSPKHYKTIQAFIVESPSKETIQAENKNGKIPQPKSFNSVAFIIGDMSDSSQSETDSENEDSDWSDYEPMSNDDFLQEFAVQDDPFSLFSVQVTCTNSPIPKCVSEPLLSPRQKLDYVNLQWNEAHSNLPGVKQSSKKLSKKVSFADGKKIATTYPMIAWDYAYRAARKAPWEMYARDRCRFMERVRSVERSIGCCINSEHRDKMYAKLYAS